MESIMKNFVLLMFFIFTFIYFSEHALYAGFCDQYDCQRTVDDAIAKDAERWFSMSTT
jgi:hypothetical protein